MSQNKFCVGCRHMAAVHEPVYGEVVDRLCRSSLATRRRPNVDLGDVVHCRIERQDSDGCGPAGQYWEAKWL